MEDEKEENVIGLKEVGTAAIAILSNTVVQKMLLGTYSDGETRSLPDALNGEVLSPKSKEKYKKKKDKKKDNKYNY